MGAVHAAARLGSTISIEPYKIKCPNCCANNVEAAIKSTRLNLFIQCIRSAVQILPRPPSRRGGGSSGGTGATEYGSKVPISDMLITVQKPDSRKPQKKGCSRATHVVRLEFHESTNLVLDEPGRYHMLQWINNNIGLGVGEFYRMTTG